MVHIAAASSKAELQVQISKANESLAAAQKAEAQLVVLELAYMAFFAALLLQSSGDQLDAAGDIIIFDPAEGSPITRIKCDVADVELPFTLEEFCCWPALLTNNYFSKCAAPQPGCPDPYLAYVNWCDPRLCHELKQKRPYLKTMQLLAAIGGLYGMLTLFVVAIVWNCCVLGCWPQ